jgi:hypothetical protein
MQHFWKCLYRLFMRPWHIIVEFLHNAKNWIFLSLPNHYTHYQTSRAKFGEDFCLSKNYATLFGHF